MILSHNNYTMAKKTAPLLPASAEMLRQLGDRLRLARLRRRLTAKQIAERSGMAPMTLRSIERGGSGVTIGAYVAVMQVLGVEGDLDLLAKADAQGRQLQDARLSSPARREAKAPVDAGRASFAPSRSRDPSAIPLAKKNDDHRGWAEKGGFESSQALAELIRIPASGTKKKR